MLGVYHYIILLLKILKNEGFIDCKTIVKF